MTKRFCYVACFARVFIIVFFLSNMILLSLKSCFITHIKWDVIISSSLRLLLKVWIWYRCQNRIENYYQHDWEQLDGFYKKNTISNLFDKNYTQKNVKCHIQHEESWLRWIVIEQVNYKKYYFPLILPERNCPRTLSNLLWKN